MSGLDQAASAPTTKRSWLARNWRWFVPAVFFGGLLACAVVAGAVLWSLFYHLKSTEPYQQALARVRQSSQVTARLGEPVRDMNLPAPSGNVSEEGQGRGRANVLFHVEGPKGKAVVRSESRRMAGKWDLVVVEVTFPDRTRISLDAREDNGSDAPRFAPTAGGDAPVSLPKAGAKHPSGKLRRPPRKWISIRI